MRNGGGMRKERDSKDVMEREIIKFDVAVEKEGIGLISKPMN